MRFCTSELKVAVITSALKKQYPGQDIVNVAGIRRQESPARNRMPISAPMASLTRRGNVGVSWNAIIEWKIEEVFDTIAGAGLRLHEAYTKYGASRVSRSEEHTSELQSLMRISYAVFCLKKKN